MRLRYHSYTFLSVPGFIVTRSFDCVMMKGSVVVSLVDSLVVVDGGFNSTNQDSSMYSSLAVVASGVVMRTPST